MDTKLLRQKILDLAIHGKLVPQNPADEPASVLLERIKAEKEQLVKDGEIKKSAKTSDTNHDENVPFEIPSSWVWTTLGEISNYGDSENIDVSKIDENSWVLELEDIEKDTANIPKRLLLKDRKINGVRHKFKKGHILYSKLRTYLNKALVAPEDGFCTTEIMSFYTYDVLCNTYLCHVLRSQYFLDYTLQCGYGVKMPRLSTADACKGFIPLPPLSEQRRIVAEIEKWFSLIDIIESSKNDLQSTIKQTKSKILDLAIHGKLVPQNPKDEPAIELLKRINPKAEINCDNGKSSFDVPNNWLLMQGKSIFAPMRSTKPTANSFLYADIDSIDNRLNTSHPKSVETHLAPSRASRYTEKGDVLFSMVRPYLRNIAMIESNNCIASTGFYVCHSNGSVLPKYCLNLMLSDYVVNGLNQFMKGDNSPSINKSHIDNFIFPIPPLAEQQRIVTKIEELFAVLDNIQKSLEA